MRIKRKWIAFILIMLIFFWDYQGFEGLHYKNRIHPALVHAMNLVWLVVVAYIGRYGLSHEKQKWPQSIWTAMYILFISLIIVLGMIDLKDHFNNSSFTDLRGYLRSFFASPVPFGITLFLSKNFKTVENT